MTRINVGIDPSELCDQHLVAEYREITREIGREVKGKRPLRFTLNAGHCNYCAQFQASLSDRFVALRREMSYRGMNANIVTPKRMPVNSLTWGANTEVYARPILQERIKLRLHGMKREPKWTKRQRPDWA